MLENNNDDDDKYRSNKPKQYKLYQYNEIVNYLGVIISF